MIAITFQIQTSPNNGALSVAAAIDPRGATQKEAKVCEVLNLSIRAAFEYIGSQSKTPANLLVAEGDESVLEFVKARLEAGGVRFDDTLLDQATRTRNQGQG